MLPFEGGILLRNTVVAVRDYVLRCPYRFPPS